MKKILFLIITLSAVAFKGYSQVDFVVSSAGFSAPSIPVGGTANFLTFIAINETSPGGQLAPGCLELIISFPASASYVPTGGVAAVAASGFGPSFNWTFVSSENALYGYNNVVLADGDGGLITVGVTGMSIITNATTSSNASDALNCTSTNSGDNDDKSATLSVTAPLPVRLTGFKTRSLDCDGINLTWATESEVNSKGFGVERSTDGIDFKEISFVPSNQNSSVKREYSYEDTDIKTNGTYYYRLVQLDLDGTFKVSETIAHEFNCFDVTDFSIYPNPTSDKLNLNFNGIKGDVIEMDLLDAQGKLIRKISVNPSSVDEVSVRDLPPGFYSLQFTYVDQLINRKFIKIE